MECIYIDPLHMTSSLLTVQFIHKQKQKPTAMLEDKMVASLTISANCNESSMCSIRQSYVFNQTIANCNESSMCSIDISQWLLLISFIHNHSAITKLFYVMSLSLKPASPSSVPPLSPNIFLHHCKRATYSHLMDNCTSCRSKGAI